MSVKALELAPDDLWPNHCHAVVRRWQGDLDTADSYMARALANSPDYSLGLFTIGEIDLARGRLTAAIEHLERAIRLDPSYRHQYLQFLAMAHFLKGNFETAAVILRERVFLVKDTDVGRAWLAAACGQIGEHDEARQVWADLMQINPDFSITGRLARLSLSDPAHPQMVLDGLRKAGLPTDG